MKKKYTESKKHLFTSLFLFVIFISYAQKGIVSTGGLATSAGCSMSFSVGQIDYSSAQVNGSFSINQGLQQPNFEVPLPLGNWLGLVSANWSDASNWFPNLPTGSNDISIFAGSPFVSPIVNGNFAVNNLTVASGVTLSISGTNTLSINGNALFNSNLDMNHLSTIILSGASQTLSGSGVLTISNLVLSGSGLKTFNTPIIITNKLEIGENIELQTFNNLTLLSGMTTNGRITTIPNNATVTGNVTVQRYIPAKRALRFVSSPVQNATLSQWKPSMLVTGNGGTVAGFDNTGPDMATSTYYVESITGGLNVGWARMNNINDVFAPGIGYQVVIRGDRTSGSIPFSNLSTTSTNIQFTGLINQGTVNLPLTFSNYGVTSVDGWNLVGNPFPCQIDWDNASGWSKSGIENAIYIWDPLTEYTSVTTTTGKYFSVVGGLASDLRANPSIIPIAQGFFVKATTTGASLMVNENAKSSLSHFSNFRTENNVTYFGMSVTNAKNDVDYTVIRFSENATNGFENGLDARKMKHSGLNFYTQNQNTDYSINSISNLDSNFSIPLVIESSTIGKMKIDFKELARIESNYTIYLVDTLTKDSINITSNAASHSFESASAQSTKNRFFINGSLRKSTPEIGEEVTSKLINFNSDLGEFMVSPNPVLENEKIKISSKKPVSEIKIKVYNINGIVCYENTLRFEKNTIEIENEFNTGVYVIEINHNGEVKRNKLVVYK